MQPLTTHFTHALVLLLATGGAASCASVGDEAVASGAAAATDATIDVEHAAVALCDEVEGGCAPCSATIGDHALSPEERQSCPLRDLRPVLRERVKFLFAEAGRRGIFLRTATGGGALRLARISILPAVGGNERAREDIATKLNGSFTAGEGGDLSGGVDVYSARMSVRFAFQLEETIGGAVVRTEPYVMTNTYHLIPFFSLSAKLAVNLSVGAILSRFGGGEIASALLSALGGQASMSLEASHDVRWATPVCSDTRDDRSGSMFRVFDYDFFQNVLVRACEQYRRDHGADLRCELDTDLTGSTETFAVKSARAIGGRLVLPFEGCSFLERSTFSPIERDAFKVDFLAPREWGFAPGHEGYLVQRNDRSPEVWTREPDRVKIIGVDHEACGASVPGDDEVCVHGELYGRFFDATCDRIQAGSREFGLSQTEGAGGRIVYAVPPR